MPKARVLAVIPARGGSKAIPNKNLADVGGRPLITYTIDAALASRHITDLVVSTDSEKIAAVARAHGLAVPFLRPTELSTHTALSLPVVLHALEFMESQESAAYDAVLMLQPTTPLRTAHDVDSALGLLLESDADSVISVVDVCGYHPLRMKRIVAGQLVNYIEQGHEDMRPRQELPPVYIRNGAIYATLRSVLVTEQTFAGSFCRPYIMPVERSINIDTTIDLRVVRELLQDRRGGA